MRFPALVSDYDGTLAHDGHVDADTVAALVRLRESGRKLVLVTGRELDELQEVFPHLGLCDQVVAENGALLYEPVSGSERLLAHAPPTVFVRALREIDVAPLSVGRVIVATRESQIAAVEETIRRLHLELRVILNKGSVMVLPAGVNKATGLSPALEELELSASDTLGVGDAENDHDFLAICGYAVAVANALPALKERCDWTTPGARGAGVVQLIDRLIRDDLPPSRRHSS
jgi:hydroxymethylpyrimidine pyrophosphatase-like HAD family hydrolase